MINTEIWKPIIGYEDAYEVSNTGRVKSLERYVKSGTQCVRERILKPGINRYGYFVICLSKEGRRIIKTVHRLVAKAFLREYREDLQTDHRDGDKLYNSSSNLRMFTRSQNNRAFNNPRKGVTSRFRGVGWYRPSAKWRAKISFEGKSIHIGYFIDEADAAKAWNKKATELGFFSEALNDVSN